MKDDEDDGKKITHAQYRNEKKNKMIKIVFMFIIFIIKTNKNTREKTTTIKIVIEILSYTGH